MDKILDFLKPANLKYALIILGLALLGRSLAILRPEYGITVLGPHEQPQDILMYFNVEVERYIMTMLWPLAYALLNSIHQSARVSREFFRLVMAFNVLCLCVGYYWYFGFVPEHAEGFPDSTIKSGQEHMVLRATVIFVASLLTTIVSYIWFTKCWVILDNENKEPNKAG